MIYKKKFKANIHKIQKNEYNNKEIIIRKRDSMNTNFAVIGRRLKNSKVSKNASK